jgi:hypothetical protein
MVSGIARIVFAGTLVIWPLQATIAESVKSPQSGASVETDPKDLSKAFWTDWKTTKASPQVTVLAKSIGAIDKTDAAVKAASKDRKQAIVPVVINRPQEAAKLLEITSEKQDTRAPGKGGAAVDPKGTPKTRDDQAGGQALRTVITMTVPPETRKAAMRHVPPAARQRVESWRADLNTGIRGLPGIYLSGNHQTASGGMRPAPAGYAPVSGGSVGCRSRQ